MGERMRIPDWDKRLARRLHEAGRIPFEWGTHDCATWSFDTRDILIGKENREADRWRGKYQSAGGAWKIMRRSGWPDLKAMGRSILGEPMANPLMAKRGDICLFPSGRIADGMDWAFGICAGSAIATTGLAGGTLEELSEAALAWEV